MLRSSLGLGFLVVAFGFVGVGVAQADPCYVKSLSHAGECVAGQTTPDGCDADSKINFRYYLDAKCSGTLVNIPKVDPAKTVETRKPKKASMGAPTGSCDKGYGRNGQGVCSPVGSSKDGN